MKEGIGKLNVSLFVLSLVMSLFLWAIVYAQNTPVSPRTLYPRLVPVGLPDRFQIVGPAPDFAVEVVGTAPQLDRLERDGVTARVDLKNPKEGRHKYPVFLDPSLAQDLATNTNLTATYTIEALIERKLPITVTTTGRLGDTGHVYMDYVVNPKLVTITAIKSNLLKVASARVELDLNVVDANKPEPVTSQIYLYDENGQRLTDVALVAPLTADVTPILSPSSVKKTVFLNVPFRGSPAAGFVDTSFSVSPNQVTINGSPDVVNSLSQVDTDAVDLTGLSGDRTVEVTVHLPHGVASATPTKVKVKVSVKKSGKPPADAQ